MAEYSLEAQMRTVVGKKVKRIRNSGMVPGTVYGPKTDPIKVQFGYRQLEKTLMSAGGTNLIDINVEGDKTYPVLARDVQRDILKGDILHVDFFAVDMQTKIRADIPLDYVGESPMIASRKGIMITGPNSVTVEMLPSNLINQIKVDVSTLVEMGDTISVKDLPLDDSITVINDPEEMIARIVQPSAARALEREEALEAEGLGVGEGIEEDAETEEDAEE